MNKNRFNLNKDTVNLSVKPTSTNVYESFNVFLNSKNMDDFIKFWVKLRNIKVYFPALEKLHLIHKEDYIEEEELLKINLLEYTYPLQYFKNEHWAACFTNKDDLEKIKPVGTHIFETRFVVLYLYYLSYVDKNYVDGIVIDPFNNNMVIDKNNMKKIFSLEMDLLNYFKENKIYDN